MLSGIQRVAEENIFSDLNNLVVCDVVDSRYSHYFGFDPDEVKGLLKNRGLELNAEVKNIYDGYRMGSVEIYNPWSILNYIDTKKLIPFWVNTSSNTMIKSAIKQADLDFKEQYENLIQNGYLETEVNLQTSFYEGTNFSTLWGLFVNAGYLIISKVLDYLRSKCRIEIPNNEVEREFVQLLKSI